MSSSDSEGGDYYSNIVKGIRKDREQCRNNFKRTEVSTGHTGNSHEGSSAVQNIVNTKNVENYTNDGTFIDSTEDDLLLNEILARNSKPTRGRGRGRGRKSKIIEEAPITPEVRQTRSRGRGRRAKISIEAPETSEVSPKRGRGLSRGGKRGRPSKKNTETSLSDTLISNAFGILNSGGSRNKRKRNGVNDSTMDNILGTLTGARKDRGRKKTRTSYSPNSSDVEFINDVLTNINGMRQVPPTGQRATQQISANLNTETSYPTYSIGNTAEYEDKSDDIPIFSRPKNVTDDVIILDDQEQDDNEDISLKVIWKSLKVYKFTIRKYQKLTKIFDSFTREENVGKDKLLFTYNNQILTCDDTPASIDYNIAKFIDGGIVSQSITNIVRDKAIVNGIQIKFQCQNTKKPLEITIKKDDKVLSAMTQCAEQMDLPLNKLKFEFDGDPVTGTCTPQQMGLENGDCIDFVILS